MRQVIQAQNGRQWKRTVVSSFPLLAAALVPVSAMSAAVYASLQNVSESRAQSQACLSYAEANPDIACNQNKKSTLPKAVRSRGVHSKHLYACGPKQQGFSPPASGKVTKFKSLKAMIRCSESECRIFVSTHSNLSKLCPTRPLPVPAPNAPLPSISTNTWPLSSFPTVCSTTSTSYGPMSLHDDLFTFLSNKAGHCRQGTIVAAVRGTRAEDVISILMQIPEEDRLAVKEVTLGLSSSL